MSRKKIYHGWYIVATGFLLMALQFSPSINLSGLFVPSLTQEFSASRTAVVTNTTIMIFAGIGGTLFSGKILARFDMRRTICVSLLISSIANLGYAFSPSLWVMYLFSVLRGSVGSLTHMVPISILVTNWFGPKMRGRATGIAMVGSGVGSFVLNPIVGNIIHNYNWRYGYMLFASFGLVLIPLVWFTIRRTPQEMGLAPLGAEAEEAPATAQEPRGIPAGQALKSSTFWLIMVALVVLNGICQCWNNNGASFFGDIGLSPVVASSLLSATAAGIIGGKLLLGFICDRFGARFGASFGVSFLLFGYALATFIGPNVLAAAIVAVLMGLGIASSSMSTPLVTGELFGSRDYGVLVGYLNVGVNLGASVVPLLLTILYDNFGSFIPSWYLAAGIAVLTIILINAAYARRKKITVL